MILERDALSQGAGGAGADNVRRFLHFLIEIKGGCCRYETKPEAIRDYTQYIHFVQILCSL